MTATPLLDLSALLNSDRPPRAWTWWGVIPEGDQVSIYARAGEGKSLLALALAVAAARGDSEFIGRPLNVPGRVLYVDMENSEDDLRERLTDLGVDGSNVAAFADRLLIAHLPTWRGLDTYEGAADLREVLEAYGIGAGDLLVLDSTQRVIEGRENDADTMRALYRHTLTKLKRLGVTVLRTDNTGHNTSRERGSAGKRDDVANAWQLRTDVDGHSSLECRKRRGRPESDDRLTFHRHSEGGRLMFTPERLAYGPLTAAERTEKAVSDIVAHVAAHPGLGASAIARIAGKRKETTLSALKLAVERGAVTVTEGLFYLAEAA